MKFFLLVVIELGGLNEMEDLRVGLDVGLGKEFGVLFIWEWKVVLRLLKLKKMFSI